MSTARLGKTTIDWTNFIKLRNDETLTIVAAQCKSCEKILRSPSSRNLNNHRYGKLIEKYSLHV